jgi:hypothetical protein
MTSFYDSHFVEHSGFFANSNSGYYDSSTSQIANIYSSRGRLLEISNANIQKSSPNPKELEKCLDSLFRGFSLYSEPFEECEVQRQIKEYLKMK